MFFKKYNFIYSILFLLSILTLLFGNDLDKIKIQLKWKHQFQFAGYYAAIEKGFYKEEGLDVTLIERNLSKNVVDNIEEVISGSCEYGVADAGLLLSRYEGKPVVLLAQIFQHSPLILLSKKNSNIISPFEMIGKTVMYDQADVQFRAMFQNTIGNSSQLYLVNHSGNIKSFIDGKVDVFSSYITNEPFFLDQMGVEYNIIRPQNYGIDFYGDNLFTTEKEIANHPERVERVIRATRRGWLYALNNSDEIIEIIKKKYATNKSLEHLKYEARITKQMILPELISIGNVNEERFRMIANTYFRSGLMKTPTIPEGLFYKNISFHELVLSLEEKVWLKQHPIVSVASDPSWLPFEYADKNGQYHGIAIDYMKKIEEILDLKFNYIEGKSWQELVTLAKGKKVDIFSCITKTDERNRYLNFTEPYISAPISIYSRIDNPYIGNLNNLKGTNVAVVDGYAIHEILNRNHPEISLVPVKNISEAVKVVGDGEALCFVGNRMTTSHYLAKTNNTHIKIAGETPYKNDLSIGVRDDWQIFTGILQKALLAISEREKQEIFNNWVAVKYEHKLERSLIWKLIAASLFVILIFVIWNRMLKNEVEKRSRELSRSIINLHEEVEAKKKMMDVLSKTEMKFKAIYDQAPIGIGIVNSMTGRFLDVNEEYCRITGYVEKELLSMTFKQITHKDDIQRDVNNMELINNGSISSFDIQKRYYHKSGRLVWINLIVVPLWGEVGDKQHLAIIYDITEQKESEVQRKALEKQIRETQKMEAIGTLAGGIAHDFNNILGSMLGFTDLALESLKEDEENQRRLNYVMQGGKRAKELIDQILAFSKEKEGELKPLVIKTIIEEVLSLLRASIPTSILIESNLSSNSSVLADPTQMHQVIMNICTNAKHAMKEEGGKLSISLEDVFITEEKAIKLIDIVPGNYMCISISDTGKGMTKEVKERLFEPFFTTKGKGEGTGLGLSVVHGIIRSYGGQINVTSENEKGSQFDIYIPIVENTNDVDSNEISNESQILGGNEKFLIIDDEEILLEMLKTVLISLGYDIVAMSDPVEALAHLEEHYKEYDLIISDVTMPRITGDKLASKIHEKCDIPVILTTGYSERKMDVLLERSGAKLIITKPFVKSEIGKAVRSVLDS